MKVGSCKLSVQFSSVSYQLAVGSWQLAVGSWQLAVGSWRLTRSRRRGAPSVSASLQNHPTKNYRTKELLLSRALSLREDQAQALTSLHIFRTLRRSQGERI